ncbi:MAG: hypothetical protein OEL54_06385 [Flavobacteriaceae bacterium]|nr:hypothetical protein [Flavobacteriaceae bacterium]
MKKHLYILLLLTFSSFSYSQYPKGYISKQIKIDAGLIGAVVFDAWGDAENDNGNKALAHALNAASVACLLVTPFLADIEQDQWAKYIIKYGFIRFVAFDYTYNYQRNLPFNYLGNTSNYDKNLKKFDPGLIAFTKSVTLIVGFTIPINTKL